MDYLHQVAESLIGVGDAEIDQHLGRHVQGLGEGVAPLVVGSALALLVAAHGEHAHASGLGKIVLREPACASKALNGPSQHRR